MEKQTPHYAHPTGFALALTAGIIYALCAAFVVFWPVKAVRFFSDWFHGIDLTQIATIPQITFGSFLRGLLEVTVFFYIAGVIYGWMYNKCVAHCKRMRWI